MPPTLLLHPGALTAALRLRVRTFQLHLPLPVSRNLFAHLSHLKAASYSNPPKSGVDTKSRSPTCCLSHFLIPVAPKLAKSRIRTQKQRQLNWTLLRTHGPRRSSSLTENSPPLGSAYSSSEAENHPSSCFSPSLSPCVHPTRIHSCNTHTKYRHISEMWVWFQTPTIRPISQ